MGMEQNSAKDNQPLDAHRPHTMPQTPGGDNLFGEYFDLAKDKTKAKGAEDCRVTSSDLGINFDELGGDKRPGAELSTLADDMKHALAAVATDRGARTPGKEYRITEDKLHGAIGSSRFDKFDPVLKAMSKDFENISRGDGVITSSDIDKWLVGTQNFLDIGSAIYMQEKAENKDFANVDTSDSKDLKALFQQSVDCLDALP